jgi:hypothetical protein
VTVRWSLAVLALCMVAGSARADRVYLSSGNVIEGKAQRRDDKVIVELESGEISLPAETVVRIEAAESDVQRVDARYAKLKQGDVKGLIALADYCRDHGMREREHKLLIEVIDHEPNHAEARARLGYVRSDAGWITREEQMRAQGLVLYEGRWLTREQMLELQRLEAQTEAARRQRDEAQLAVERQKLERDRAQAEAELAEAERSAQTANATDVSEPAPSVPHYVSWGAPFVDYADCGASIGPHHRGRCRRPAPHVAHHPSSLLSVGAKDPFDYLRDGR